MTFGQKFRKLREESGFSQDNIASMLFVTTQNVIGWENDEILPSVDILAKLSQIFGVSVDELLGNIQNGNLGHPLAKVEIVSDKNEINKIFKFKFLNSISVLTSAFILLTVILSVTILTQQYIEPYNSTFSAGASGITKILLYPTAILITVLILCIIRSKTITAACNQANGNLLFYNNFITIQHTDGTSCNKQYSSVKKIYELDYYLVLLFSDGKIICIKKETSEGYFDYIINIFRSHNALKNYTVTKTRNKPKFSQSRLFHIKSIITGLTVIVIGSIYLSLMIWSFGIIKQTSSIYINIILAFLPVLIPICSLIFGIVVFCKNIKSKRLIISSAIMLFFTLIYSSLFAIIPTLQNSPVYTQDFPTVMKRQEFLVDDITTQRTENYLEKCYVATYRTGEYEIYCLEFDSSSPYSYRYALDFYNDKKEEFEEKHHVYYYDDSNGSSNNRYYTGYDDDEYFVIYIKDTTVIYSCVDFEYAENIKDIFNKIIPFHIPFNGI